LVESEGKPKLVEASQVPPEHMPEFNNLKRFGVFNTNNLWVSLKSVQVRYAASAWVVLSCRMIVLVCVAEVDSRQCYPAGRHRECTRVHG
jgi:hypothetical protein